MKYIVQSEAMPPFAQKPILEQTHEYRSAYRNPQSPETQRYIQPARYIPPTIPFAKPNSANISAKKPKRVDYNEIIRSKRKSAKDLATFKYKLY